jgi:hypothetical protein
MEVTLSPEHAAFVRDATAEGRIAREVVVHFEWTRLLESAPRNNAAGGSAQCLESTWA